MVYIKFSFQLFCRFKIFQKKIQGRMRLSLRRHLPPQEGHGHRQDPEGLSGYLKNGWVNAGAAEGHREPAASGLPVNSPPLPLSFPSLVPHAFILC